MDRCGSTPLYTAAVQGETEIVRLLLEAGADPNRESGGQSEGTPLCAAASWGRTDVVWLLLQHGADPNLAERADEVPMTALAWARRNHPEESVRLLLDNGAVP
jgi:ankyrin repeat protein